MSEANQAALEQAYELIEADKLTEAEALLKPVLERDQANADAWWLYAHAVTDPEAARMALNQVLNLDSGYAGAQDLLDQLDATYVKAQAETPAPPSLPDLHSDQALAESEFFSAMDEQEELIGPDDDFVFDDDILTETGKEVEPKRRSRPLLIVIPLLLLVLAIVLILAILKPFGAAITPQATNTVAVVENIPTFTPEGTGSASMALLPVTSTADTSASAITAALSQYEVVNETVGVLQSELGTTLIAGICSGDIHAMTDTLDQAMEAVAGIASSTGSDIDALGVALIDCSGNERRVLRVIGVPVDAAVAYSAGDMDAKDFQAQWRPVA